ncbi:fatty acyl-AMP ligase [Alteromonas sp. a30]|uniref:fatty acyl-AMP ligase n=1 Tax=Alteromonas sp. a30 TaxID=2730917 RepID=UPI0022806BF0|nr:fatty acyl-AMP ligase [Alteromonas sp. a30]MCY7294071.1 fatty acyl-AMP ligase [Alteromonas sp. a30]
MYSDVALNAQLKIEPTESKPNFNLRTFAEIIEFRAKYEGSKEAFSYCFDGEGEGEEDIVTWSYRDLKNAIAFASQKINQHNIKNEKIVLLFEPGLAFIAAYLATICSGAIAVPCHPPMGKRQIQRLHTLIQDSDPKLVLFSDVIRHSTPQLSQLIDSASNDITFKEIHIPMQPQEMPWQHPNIEEDAIAMLQYTSASTGEPKGVQLTHKNLVKNSEAIYKWLSPYPNRKGCIWLPPYHDMGLLGGIMQPLYAGFPLVFMSPMHFVQQPIRWLKLISRHKLTTTGAPNFAFQLCVDAISTEEIQEAQIDLSSIKELFCGSEPINATTMQAFEEKFAPYGLDSKAINPCYGMAETTLFVSGKEAGHTFTKECFDKEKLKVGKAIPVPKGADNAQCIVSCGSPGSELNIRIIDPEQKRQVSSGCVGEIWVAGPSVSQGYWNMEALSQQAFNNSLAGEQGKFYRTGDLGFYHKGELYVTGRIKDVIIIRGRNLYPQDIEQIALSIETTLSLLFSAAFSVQEQDTEALIIAVEVKGRPEEGEIQALREKIRVKVTNEFRVSPKEILVVPALSIPRTTSGKIQRFACKNAWKQNLLRQFKRREK